jgi:hypothetical protein
MKKLILVALFSIPALSLASSYSCTGLGFSIEASTDPAEMNISGNGFNDVDTMNTKSIVMFDTIVTGSSTSPMATLKLTIREGTSSSSLLVSSSSGIKDYVGLSCSLR